jgi:hypothetical protein
MGINSSSRKRVQTDDEPKNLCVEFRSVLLGPKESGKSMILSQLKSIMCENPDQETLRHYTNEIYAFIIRTIKTMAEVAKHSQISMSSEENDAFLLYFSELDQYSINSDIWEDSKTKIKKTI